MDQREPVSTHAAEAPADASATATGDASLPTTASSSEAFVNIVGGMVEQEDVRGIINQQTLMLSRFEKTNVKLEQFNCLEAGRFDQAMEQFRSHTRVLTDMKKDLDSVFRRIRVLRGKLTRQYPGAFEASEQEHAAEEKEEGCESGSEEGDVVVASHTSSLAAVNTGVSNPS